MVDYSNLIEDTFAGEQQAAKSQVVGSVDAEPDKAARAMELGQAWGIAPTIVLGDMDNFERTQKTMLASQIVGNNQHLQNYVNSNPLAAHISNDDFGQLDAASQAYTRAIGSKSLFMQYAGKPISILGSAFEGFKEGFGSEPVGSWIGKTEYGQNYIKRYPYSAYLLALEGGAFEIPARIFTGGLQAIKGGVSETLKQAGVGEQQAERFSRDVTGMAEQQLMGLTGVKVPVAQTFEALRPIEPYVRAGKEPPPGVSEVVDAVKAEQASLDAENLGKAIKEAAGSATLERSPQMMEQFYAQHPQGSVGISADAIREVYGPDKQPAPGDGLLGDLPNMRQQLEAAEAIGGDVDVPLKNFIPLAAQEPELYKALEDHIRFREAGLTVEEAKQGIEVYHGSPHEFEAFDIGKAGTGEGAQSYGFGHYFAENPDVSETYTQAGKMRPMPYKYSVNGKEVSADAVGTYDNAATTETAAAFRMHKANDARDVAIAAQERRVASAKGEDVDPAFDKEVLEILKSGDIQPIEPPKGNMYKARILRRPEEFLDWDAKIEDQSPEVKKVLTELGYEVNPAAEDYDLITGRDIYRRMHSFDQTPEQGSKKFGEAGIAGIKYLDQFSREAEKLKGHIVETKAKIDTLTGEARATAEANIVEWEKLLTEPTRNFVVFRDSDIEILERNGEAVRTLREANRLQPMGVPEGEPIIAKRPEQLELPQDATTRMEDRAAFDKAAAIGMTKDQYARYQRLIAERQEADAKAMDARAMAEQRKVQSAEWKANRAELRPQVADEIRQRPEFELDEELRGGKLKFATEALTDEQLAALPKDYVAKDGVHPDDLAGLYGYDSGVALVNDLVALVNARTASGMKPKAFIERAIDAETDRRMEQKYGKLDENILEEAKDQVLSAIQEEMLHEEMLALAEKAGAQFSLTKSEVAAWVKEKFDGTLVSSISSDKFLQAAGKAGRATELALLKKDPAEAFRQKQRQFLAFSMATAARKLEKSLERFEKIAKRFSAREVSGVHQEYTNWIHDILGRTGNPVKRSVQDLQESLARGGQTGTTTLADFAAYKEAHDLREVPIADFLTDASYRKEVGQMTAAEFEAVHNSIKALVANGRDEAKIIKAGEAADLAVVKEQMLEQIRRFAEKEYDVEGKRVQPLRGVRRLLRTALVSHLQVETVLNRLDRFDPRGVFSQYIFRELASSANHEALLLREFSKKLGAIADNVNLREVIPDSPFVSPFQRERTDAAPLQMTRKNLRAVILNMGNESNFHKLATGFLKAEDPTMEPGGNRVEMFKQEIRDWVNTHAKQEDWAFAQKVWDLLEELHQKSNTMYRGLAGIEPESLVINPIQTPFGELRGGYYPLIRHPTFSADIKLPKNGLEGEGYYRATTPAGYTKSRTGAIYPLDLSLDALPNTLRQIIHDISFRPAVIQAGKIFYDKQIMAELKSRLGKEYADMFVPWLRDVANVQNFMSAAEKDFNKFSDFMRQNAITTLVGLNVGTFMKHTPTAIASSMAEVGPVDFLNAMRSLTSINEATGESNWSFAMQKSEELQRRSRNWLETMGGGLAVMEGRTVGKALAQGDVGAAFMSLRDTITEISSKPVALGDLMSAVPTWLAIYKREMSEHGVLGDAVYAADKAVRQAHGSSAVTSRSRVARSRSALGSWMTGFFTFFNDLMNRQVETLWRAGEIKGYAKEGDYAKAMSEAKVVTGRLLAYVVAPAMIEELVTPLASDKNESWGSVAAKSLLFTLSSSWVGVRDIVNAALNGRDPSVGLLSTMGKSATDTIRDLASKHQKPGNVIKHGTQLSGMLTGLTPAPIGRAAEFSLSKEHPRGPWGWLVGLRYGTLKGHSPTFEQYMRGH